MGTWEIPVLDISQRLKDPYPVVLESVVQGLKQEGFVVVTDLDLQEALRRKLSVDSLPFKMLRVYHPDLAAQAHTLSPHIALLPYRVNIAELEDGEVEISIVDPLSVLVLADHPELVPIISLAYRLLQRLADSLPGL